MISAEEIKALRKKYEQQIAAMDEKSVREELEDWWIGSNANAKKFNELYARISTLQTLLNQVKQAYDKAEEELFWLKEAAGRDTATLARVVGYGDCLIRWKESIAAIESYLTKEGE